jgi:hypothetical protein
MMLSRLWKQLTTNRGFYKRIETLLTVSKREALLRSIRKLVEFETLRTLRKAQI